MKNLLVIFSIAICFQVSVVTAVPSKRKPRSADSLKRILADLNEFLDESDHKSSQTQDNLQSKKAHLENWCRNCVAQARGGDAKTASSNIRLDDVTLKQVKEDLDNTLQTLDGGDKAKRSPQFNGNKWRLGGATGRGGDAKTSTSNTEQDNETWKRIERALKNTLQTLNNGDKAKRSPQFKSNNWRLGTATGRGGDAKTTTSNTEQDNETWKRIEGLLENALQTKHKDDAKRSPAYIKGNKWRLGGATGRGGDAKTSTSNTEQDNETWNRIERALKNTLQTKQKDDAKRSPAYIKGNNWRLGGATGRGGDGKTITNTNTESREETILNDLAGILANNDSKSVTDKSLKEERNKLQSNSDQSKLYKRLLGVFKTVLKNKD